MPTASLGLTLTYPAQGSRGWYSTAVTLFEALSAHDHTGSGKGVQIVNGALANDAVTGAKFRLANDEYLRARDAANSADINLFKLNSSDQLEIAATLGADLLYAGARSLLANTSDGSDSGAINIGGGGAISDSRGAFLRLFGNENGTAAGSVILRAGVTGDVAIETRASGKAINLYTNSTLRFSLDGNGHFIPNVNNTYDIGSASKVTRAVYGRSFISDDNLVLDMGASKDFALKLGGSTIFAMGTSGTGFAGQTLSAGPFSISTYWAVTINGTPYYIPLHVT